VLLHWELEADSWKLKAASQNNVWQDFTPATPRHNPFAEIYPLPAHD
jgi:hypothetical protein